MRGFRLAACGLLLAAAELGAQGAIFGTVSDSSGAPIPDVDVVLQPASKRTRSDAAGRYAFEELGNGGYTVYARKLGFAPQSYEARISAKGRVQVNLVMQRRTDLDTIRVVGTCDGLGVTNFECRRKSASTGSIFLDYPEIDAFGERYVADLFRHIPGFAVRNGGGASGHVFPSMVLLSKPYKCLITLVDGMELGMPMPPYGRSNAPPIFTKDLVGLEIYPRVDSVPIANKRYVQLAANGANNARRCGVLLYWTVWAPIVPPRQSLAPKSPSQLRGISG